MYICIYIQVAFSASFMRFHVLMRVAEPNVLHERCPTLVDACREQGLSAVPAIACVVRRLRSQTTVDSDFSSIDGVQGSRIRCCETERWSLDTNMYKKLRVCIYIYIKKVLIHIYIYIYIYNPSNG